MSMQFYTLYHIYSAIANNRMVLKKIFLCVQLVICFCFAQAQIDTEFWFAAPSVCVGHANKPIVFRISSYDRKATVVISQPANPTFQPYTVALNAYSATSVNVTSQIDAIENLPPDAVLNKGIHITSDAPISVYYEVEGRAGGAINGKTVNPEIFVLKGKICKGRKFLIPGQTRFNNAEKDKPNVGNYTPQPKNGFVIVATEDNTTIQINLSQEGVGHAAKEPFTIVLNKGQSFAVNALGFLGAQHIGGSSVSADKPICITIYDDSIGPAPPAPANRDIVGDQILPEDKIGNEFIIIRGDLTFTGSINQDFFYVLATKDNTEIAINGTPTAIINRGEIYEGTLTETSAYIKTTYPAYVYQLTGNAGEMASTNLPNIRCTGSNLVSFVRSTTEDFQLNILCKSTQVNGFLLNNQANIINASFFEDVPGTNGVWKAARINVDNLPQINSLIPSGRSTVITNSVGLFHLGFLNGNANSGSRLGYFSNFEIANLAPTTNSTLCIGSDIKLSASVIQDASYVWSGPNNFSSNIREPIIPNASQINSGKYYVTTKILGCGDFSDSIQIVLNELPTAKFEKDDTVCANTLVNKNIAFTGKAPWTLTYFDGTSVQTTSNINQSPFVVTAQSANNLVLYATKITDDNGCSTFNADNSAITSSLLITNALPTLKAVITNDTLCFGRTKNILLRFTGKAPFRFSYSDGNTAQTISQINTDTFVLAVQPTTTTKYTFTNITDSNQCTNNIGSDVTIKVLPLPIAAFTNPSEICMQDTLRCNDKSTAAGSSIVNWLWQINHTTTFGTPDLQIALMQAGTATIQLAVTNKEGCTSDTFTQTIVVNPLPTANFSISNAANCAQKPVQFVNQSLANVGTLTRWLWNFGNGNKLDTAVGTPLVQTYPKDSIYFVELQVINSKGCKSLPYLYPLEIHPSPIADFSMPEICLADAQAQFNDSSSIKGNSNQLPFTYVWQFRGTGSTPTPATSTDKNPMVTFYQASVYTITQTVTSAQGCSNAIKKEFTVNGSIPKASLEVINPANLCSNARVQIKNTSTVDFGSLTKVEIYWDWENNPSWKTVDDHPSFNKTYDTLYPAFKNAPFTKQYTIRMVAYSGTSCSNSFMQPITLQAIPNIVFSNIPGICSNASATTVISQAREVSGMSGTFNFSGTIISNNGTINTQNIAPGTYPIQYTFVSNKGCIDSASQNVTIWPKPTADFTIGNTTCAKTDVSLTDNATTPIHRITSRVWTFGDGTTINRPNSSIFTKQYNNAGTYSIAFTITTDSGCTHTASKNVTIHPLPNVSFTMPQICLPAGTGTFSSTSTIADGTEDGFSYKWNFDDPNNATGGTLKNQSHTYLVSAPPAGYQVQLQITSIKNCVNSLTQPFFAIYDAPIAKFSASDSAICVNKSIQYVDLSTSTNGFIASRRWQLANGITDTIINPKYTYRQSGTYAIQLTALSNRGCSSAVATKNIVVHPYPTLTLGGNTISVLEGGSVPVKPLYGENYFSGTELRFEWTSTPLPTYLNNNQVAVPIASLPNNVDSILYRLTLTGIGGCAVTDSIRLVVLRQLKVPNAFSPNADNINDTWRIDFIESYPSAIVEVFNRFGQRVFHSVGYNNLHGWDGTYNGQSLPVATYYYVIQLKNGRPPISGSITIVR